MTFCMRENEAFDKLKKLNLPAIFVTIWSEDGPTRLRNQWTKPKRYFSLSSTELKSLPGLDHAIPILESDLERLIAYDEENEEFVEFYYDDASRISIGKAYQQMIAWIFVEFVFAGLLSLAEEFAPVFEYEHIESLREFSRLRTNESAAESKRAFVKSTRG